MKVKIFIKYLISIFVLIIDIKMLTDILLGKEYSVKQMQWCEDENCLSEIKNLISTDYTNMFYTLLINIAFLLFVILYVALKMAPSHEQHETEVG